MLSIEEIKEALTNLYVLGSLSGFEFVRVCDTVPSVDGRIRVLLRNTREDNKLLSESFEIALLQKFVSVKWGTLKI